MAGFDPRQYWEERHRRTSGLDGVGYLELAGYNEWMYQLRDRVFRRAMRPHVRSMGEKSVLDVGSGTGFYLSRWADWAPAKLVGSDLSEHACERLRGEFPKIPIEHLDIANANDDQLDALGKFDFISIIDVLYHIVDPDAYSRTFRNLARLLAPDGKLVFTENFLHINRPKTGDWHVMRKLDDIERAMNSAGLVLEKRLPMFVLMNNPIDSENSALHLHWWMVRRLSARSRRIGGLMGALTYPADLLLTRIMKESPSTQLAFARRAD